MNGLRFLLTVATLTGLAGPALAAPNPIDAMKNALTNTITTSMGEQNKSNQTGTATIKDVTGGVQVKVTLKNEPRGASEPSHIHKGSCSKLNPAPWKPLRDIKNGTSTTVIKGISVADLKRGHYAINVHKSAEALTTYVSCGDL